MYELTQVAGNSYYIQSPAKIGLVRLNDADVCLIDSGNDKEAGRKVRQILDANGWHLTAIYNTHSNADHIGGNQYLQNQTGCKIYAPGIECDFTRHPVLEPSFLYGGYPPKELQHKFLMAKPSDAQELTPACLPEGFELLQLPGHFFDMVGFRTPDDVVYLADCLSSRETLEKYQIGFLYDVAAYLNTLEMVKTLSGRAFVPRTPRPRRTLPRSRSTTSTRCSRSRTSSRSSAALRRRSRRSCSSCSGALTSGWTSSSTCSSAARCAPTSRGSKTAADSAPSLMTTACSGSGHELHIKKLRIRSDAGVFSIPEGRTFLSHARAC